MYINPNTCITTLFLTILQDFGLQFFSYSSCQLSQITGDDDWLLSHHHCPGKPWSSNLRHEYLCHLLFHYVDHPQNSARSLLSSHAIQNFFLIRRNYLRRRLRDAFQTMGWAGWNLYILHCQRSHSRKQGKIERRCASRNPLRTHWRQHKLKYSHWI